MASDKSFENLRCAYEKVLQHVHADCKLPEHRSSSPESSGSSPSSRATQQHEAEAAPAQTPAATGDLSQERQQLYSDLAVACRVLRDNIVELEAKLQLLLFTIPDVCSES